MKCYECGGTYQNDYGELMLFDDSIGQYSVSGIHYEKCDGCGELMFPSETIDVIERVRERLLMEAIRSEPIQYFISAAETATMLGISRQALHKHRRIRRGFIYHTTIGGIALYHKKSVDEYMSNGDGRFPLYHPVIPRVTRYKKDVLPVEFTFKYESLSSTMDLQEKAFSNVKFMKPKEVHYADRT